MKLKELFSRLLNPRARYQNIPSMLDNVTHAQVAYENPMGAKSNIRLRDILTNPPLILGVIITLGLFAVVLYGPVWAPQNPYIAGQHIVPHYDYEKEEFIRPPLIPSEEYPFGTDQWGADLLSLLMHGARNTLVACAFITMLRVLIGVALGGAAGWHEGRWIDRWVMASIGIITALPLLITTMILIFALDIRRGLPVFIIALSLLGWTEIAQYIRSEFLTLRKQPFIEGAVSVGMTSLQIAVRQVLPNILPQLLIITFLEMGAVLMLIGELGFVQVYIGGGNVVLIDDDPFSLQIGVLADVPEWGAMLAEGYRWLRSKPHVVVPPALAFFVSVLGFNSLGEGLRRLIEKRGLNTSFLLKKRMLGVIAGMTLAVVFIMNNTGAAPWFAEIARNFNGETAYQHALTLSEMGGRGIGQPGGQMAYEYIAGKFAEYGLEPGWRSNEYLMPLTFTIVQPETQPILTLLDGNGSEVADFQHQLDFGFLIDDHAGNGDITAPITFVGFQPNRHYEWEDFNGLDLTGHIVLLVKGNAPADFASEALIRGAVGLLWVTNNERDGVRSQIQLADDPVQYLREPTLPAFTIRPTVAEQILTQASTTLPELFSTTAPKSQEGDGWFTQELGNVQGQMSIQLSEPKEVEMPAVLGYKIGSDVGLSSELVVIFTSYDGLGTDPDGTVYPGANHSASGMGIQLEIARLWQEQSLDPRRTVLLMAWPHNQLGDSGAQAFLDSNLSFRHLRAIGNTGQLMPTIFFQLDYLGAGEPPLLIAPGSDSQLTQLMEETALEFELPIIKETDSVEFPTDSVTTQPAWLMFKWVGNYPTPNQDTPDQLDKDKIQQFGQMFTLALTKVLRETDY